MENIQLEGRTIEPYCGRNVDTAPTLSTRYNKGEGVILSEADIRLLGIRNFRNAPELANNYWDTSTLSATKGEIIKVILPYEIGSKTLTESARFGLGLINPNEELVNFGVNLDVDGRWEKLEGNGVYTLQRKGLILNKDLTEAQAMKHKLILTKLGHPDYVDDKFARSKDEVEDIIGRTFELGKSEHDYNTMMGQYMQEVSNQGILTAWYVNWLGGRARSSARASLGSDCGRFAFDSVGDAKTNAEGVDDKARVQLKTLERILKPEQINEFRNALNERNELRSKLSGLTTNQIYSAIHQYTLGKDEKEVRSILNKLTGQ